jgi:WD40 repeat protein
MVANFNSAHSNQTYRYEKFIETAGITKIAFSPNGRFLASSDSQGYGKLWDVLSGREVHAFSDEKVPLFGEMLSFNEDGKILAGSAYFWDVATGKLISSIGKNATDILGAILAISSDLRTAASVFLPENQIITQIWDVETGRILCNLAGMSPFSFVLESEQ